MCFIVWMSFFFCFVCIGVCQSRMKTLVYLLTYNIIEAYKRLVYNEN